MLAVIRFSDLLVRRSNEISSARNSCNENLLARMIQHMIHMLNLDGATASIRQAIADHIILDDSFLNRDNSCDFTSSLLSFSMSLRALSI